MKPDQTPPTEETDAAKLETSGGRVPRLVVPFSAAPWYHDREEFADWGWVRDSNGLLVAKCALPLGTDENQHRRDGTDPTEGNARLIAAAPELFSVLDALIREMDDYGKRTEKARALLARIRGHNAGQHPTAEAP